MIAGMDTKRTKSGKSSGRRRGRPTRYGVALTEVICARIAAGSNLNRIAGEMGMPSNNVLYEWLRIHPEFREKYDAARRARADARSDRMDDYVGRMLKGELDPRVVQVALRSEQWQAGREAPKRFGDRMSVEAAEGASSVSFVITGLYEKSSDARSGVAAASGSPVAGLPPSTPPGD